MRLGARAKLVLVAALFAAPIVASILVYRFGHVEPTANHGELLLPPDPVSDAAFARPDGSAFSFRSLRGRWVLVAADSGACESVCVSKLVAIRQVRLALGRNAQRIVRVFVVDDERKPDPAALAPFPGMEVAIAPKGLAFAPGAAGDRGQVYLVDPNGNVMMRWRAMDDPGGMIKDLERLLRASQIG